MYVQHLTLTNFRNYARLDMHLQPGVILLHGANAQGKTSLLESIYYLATARSPWTSSDRQLLNWSAESDVMPFLRIASEVVPSHDQARRIEITLLKDLGTERFSKQINIDGVKRRSLDLLGKVNVVMFLPQDLALVEGDPSGRRRYLNITLAQVNTSYAEALTLYDKALTQRNAVLKRIAERFSSPSELDYWDNELARTGGVIISGRQHLLRELEVLATRIHAELTDNAEVLELRYKPSFQASADGVYDGASQLAFDELGLDIHRQLSPTEIEKQFRAALLKLRREEINRGMTLIGPQRDELRFSVNGRDLGLFGSRGQARTCVLALKLAELSWMESVTGEPPILLLDEFVAELDAQRRIYLLNKVRTARQAILTTTERDFFTLDFLRSASVWKVNAGRVEPD